MSELRQNLATREWVIMAPERLKGRALQKELNPLLDTHPDYADITDYFLTHLLP